MTSSVVRRFLALAAVAIGASFAPSPQLQAQRPQPQSPPASPPQTAAPQTLPKSTGRWQVRYLYDENKSTLALADLCFASPARGVAVGTIVEDHRREHVAVVTADGGEHWQQVPLREAPRSLFFLNESLGWLVTDKGLWRTTEAGKNWQKLDGFPRGMAVVRFLDEKYGLAAGARKSVFETRDGGENWKPLAAAAEPPGEAKYSAYTWIAFIGRQSGIITGFNQPPRRDQPEFPDWMDPEAAMAHRETPHLSYTLVTIDGGQTWKSASSSLFGKLTRVRLGPQGLGLGLVEYGNSFRVPSEVYRLDWPKGENRIVYRDRQFAVNDLALLPNGTAYLAGIQVPGQIRGVAPGKVRVLESRNAEYTAWAPLDVDYRAVANRAVFSILDGNNLWMATDNGMILKLVR